MNPTNFENNLEEAQTDRIGMWVFLATELCFLAALFLAFFIYRHDAHKAFHLGSKHMNIFAGTINTAILLTSSFCIAVADWAYKTKNFKLAFYLMISTITLGTSFLTIKIFEYAQHIHEHLLPGFNFQYTGLEERGVKMFFVLYYLMTAFHALHLIIGLGALTFITVKVYRRAYKTEAPRGIELGALYWHFVDLIWVFLFPLLYLADRL